MFSLPSKYLSKDNKSFCLSTKLFLVEGECAAGSMSCHCWGRWSWGSSFSTALVWHPRRPGGAPRGCDGAMDGLSPTPLLWAHSKCLWRKCGLSGRAGVPEQALSFCSQPSSSCEQSHGGGTMKSPVMCCVTLHPHLSVLLPSSCISGAAPHHQLVLECLQPLTRAVWSRVFWMVEFPVCAQVMWQQMWDRCL